MPRCKDKAACREAVNFAIPSHSGLMECWGVFAPLVGCFSWEKPRFESAFGVKAVDGEDK